MGYSRVHAPNPFVSSRHIDRYAAWSYLDHHATQTWVQVLTFQSRDVQRPLKGHGNDQFSFQWPWQNTNPKAVRYITFQKRCKDKLQRPSHGSREKHNGAQNVPPKFSVPKLFANETFLHKNTFHGPCSLTIDASYKKRSDLRSAQPDLESAGMLSIAFFHLS